jgi:2-keto-4-pentenoate hydratase/2-oxohepta-3-ene-1,7-dioic acid hydratase in catechol pathway
MGPKQSDCSENNELPMHLLSFELNGKPGWGAVKNRGVVDLGARLGGRFPTLRDAIAAGALGDLRDAAMGTQPDLGLEDFRYLPPIPWVGKFVCIGVNYAERHEEYRDNTKAPEYPSVFMRTPDSLVGHRRDILRPPESPQFDYEGEIALVIGKSGRRIPKDKAWEHVFGFSCVNEGTLRDWSKHGRHNATPGKNFVASGAWGPWIVTADEFDETQPMTVTTRVNGEQRQHESTERLIFSFKNLVHYVSTFTVLHAGDVISTGTPTGAGARFNPPRWLKHGDVVEVSVSGVGTLRNTVADEFPQ